MAPTPARKRKERKEREDAVKAARNKVALAWDKERTAKIVEYDKQRQAALPDVYEQRDVAVAFNEGLCAYVSEFFDAHGGVKLAKQLNLGTVIYHATVNGQKVPTTQVDTSLMNFVICAFKNPENRFTTACRDYDLQHHEEKYHGYVLPTDETFDNGTKIYVARLAEAKKNGSDPANVPVPTLEEAEL